MPEIQNRVPHDNKVKPFSQILLDICKSENIKIYSMSQSELNKFCGDCGGGFAMSYGQGDSISKVIAFDKARGKREKQFIVAHELAHHLLGHTDLSCTLSYEKQEFEADIFSIVLTAMGVYEEFERSRSDTF